MSFAELNVSDQFPAAYEGRGGGDGTSRGEGAAIVLRYVSVEAAAHSQAPETLVQVVLSHADDPAISWTDADGVQAVAAAILKHFTGHEPDQALLEALTMERGDDWAASAEWSLSVADLRAVVDHL